jgi:hypothetical protein
MRLLLPGTSLNTRTMYMQPPHRIPMYTTTSPYSYTCRHLPLFQILLPSLIPIHAATFPHYPACHFPHVAVSPYSHTGAHLSTHKFIYFPLFPCMPPPPLISIPMQLPSLLPMHLPPPLITMI